jgi:hypothetical protein
MSLFRMFAVCTLGLGLVFNDLKAADAVKSGPQVEEKVPGPFHPLNVTGESAGQRSCLFCSNGDNPVAVIFARKPDESLTKLIKKIDEATGKNSSAMMGSYVVFLSDSQDLEGKLKAMAAQEKVKNTVLSIDNPAGPEKYNISKEADVTVLLYTGRIVKANHSFKGTLKDADIEKITNDIPKIIK